MNKHNYSTAHDIVLLADKCMRNEVFRKVVGTKYHETYAITSRREKVTRYRWENTNKLLDADEGIIGCKTGITNAAGPCFAGYYEKDNERFIVVVLSSKTTDARWVEVPKMVEWAIKKKNVVANL